MKTLIKSFAVVALLGISSLTMAESNPKKVIVNLSTAELAIDNYVSAFTEGNSDFADHLFTKDFVQKIDAVQSKENSKSEVIKFLKKQKGELMNCQTSTEMIEETSSYAIAKVIQKFENFTRIDFITLEKTGSDWKIAKAVSTYK